MFDCQLAKDVIVSPCSLRVRGLGGLNDVAILFSTVGFRYSSNLFVISLLMSMVGSLEHYHHASY